MYTVIMALIHALMGIMELLHLVPERREQINSLFEMVRREVEKMDKETTILESRIEMYAMDLDAVRTQKREFVEKLEKTEASLQVTEHDLYGLKMELKWANNDLSAERFKVEFCELMLGCPENFEVHWHFEPAVIAFEALYGEEETIKTLARLLKTNKAHAKKILKKALA